MFEIANLDSARKGPPVLFLNSARETTPLALVERLMPFRKFPRAISVTQISANLSWDFIKIKTPSPFREAALLTLTAGQRPLNLQVFLCVQTMERGVSATRGK